MEGRVEGQTASHYRILAALTNVTIALLCAALASPLLAADRKVSKKELALKHLESIGSVEALAAFRFRIARGLCMGRGRVFSQAGEESSVLRGQAEFATGPEITDFNVVFESELYPVEGFRFDGKEIGLYGFQPPENSGLTETKYSAGQLTSNVPHFERYIKQGCFGGVLNALWPFLKPDEALPKLRSLKRKKIDGRELLVQRYHLPGSRGVELFFDPETFRHVATRCRLEVIRRSSSSLWDEKDRVTLREKFSEFAGIDGLQLPTNWTITLELPQDTSHWEISFDNVRHTEGPELKRSAKW
jgi:hypothetical protein